MLSVNLVVKADVSVVVVLTVFWPCSGLSSLSSYVVELATKYYVERSSSDIQRLPKSSRIEPE
jgi:hypothetical protein